MVGRIQLGLLVIRLTASQLPVPALPVWRSLDNDILAQWPCVAENQSIRETLDYLLCDEPLAVLAEYVIDAERVMVVRVGLAEGPWDEPLKSEKTRKRHLQTLFEALHKGWEQPGEKLLAVQQDDLDADMPKIYTSLPSPLDPEGPPTGATITDRRIYSQLQRYRVPQGVKTPLRRYQIRSVHRMLQMEVEPDQVVDLSLTPMIEAGTGHPYYLNHRTWDVVRTPQTFDLPRGGILCEQMGVGKTLISLTLILATKHHSCSPPSPKEAARASQRVSPVYNNHRLTTYPFAADQTTRHDIRLPSHHYKPAVPTLVELCANLISRHDPSLCSGLDTSDRAQHLLAEKRFYYEFPVHAEHHARRASAATNAHTKPRQVILADTTIVVVPAILVPQWKREITKHIKEGELSVYVAEDKGNLVPVEEMTKFDLILVHVHRFMMEAKTPESPLRRARWKRLMIDEGSMVNTGETSTVRFARELSIERRWLVSGTPTKHLHQGGVQLGAEEAPSPAGSRQKWSNRDRDDARRLGRMLFGFLNAALFGDGSFTTAVTNPLCGKDGPRAGSVGRLREIMQKVMVKHRAEVVDAEVELPALTVNHIAIKLDPLQALSYNVLAALITSNVFTVDSTSPSHFLHRKASPKAKNITYNFHASCFWYTQSALLYASDHLTPIATFLSDTPNLSVSTRTRLVKASKHILDAVANPLWVEWCRKTANDKEIVGIGMPFFAGDLPAEVLRAWTGTSVNNSDLVDGKSLLNMRQKNQRGTSTATVVNAANYDYRLRIDDGDGDGEEQMIEEAPIERPLPATIKTYSRSSKVNWIIQSIRSAPAEDRFVVFGTTYEIGYLTEALDLADIPCCYAGTAASFSDGNQSVRKKREDALREYEEGKVKVVMLELSLGARGLTMTVANRMIFLSPVWNPDLQAQAIKRIHRIGQARPCQVDILVTEGTMEEDIARREAAARALEKETTYWRKMIENPKFVNVTQEPSTFTIRMDPNARPLVQDPDDGVQGQQALKSTSDVKPGLPAVEDSLTGNEGSGSSGSGSKAKRSRGDHGLAAGGERHKRLRRN